MQTQRNIFAYVRDRAGVGYQRSVVRRTIFLCGLVLPGFAANFFVYFFTAQLLPADEFGLFYVALTVGNVLYSGSNILNAFLTRHLVRIGETAGRDAIAPTALRLELRIIFLGAILSALLFVCVFGDIEGDRRPVADHHFADRSRRLHLLCDRPRPRPAAVHCAGRWCLGFIRRLGCFCGLHCA